MGEKIRASELTMAMVACEEGIRQGLETAKRAAQDYLRYTDQQKGNMTERMRVERMNKRKIVRVTTNLLDVYC